MPVLDARLLQVAKQLFFGKGYGATSMCAVAEIARVSKTTLYSRFPSKTALLRAIVAEQIKNSENRMYHREPPMDYDTLEETLYAYGDVVLSAAMSTDFVQVDRLIHSESGRFPELADIARRRLQGGIDTLVGYIRNFAERDRIPCRDPNEAAELFLVTLWGWFSLLISTNRVLQPKERKVWLRRTVRALLADRPNW